nr:hypothetical protein [Tanacetum cinerariifolium]
MRTEKETNSSENEASFDKDEFNTSLDLSSFDDASKEIKMEDLSNIVKDVEVDFIDLDSLEDNEHIIVQDDKNEVEVHAEVVHDEVHKATKDELLTKLSNISREIEDFNTYVEWLEVEILRELKTIPKKIREFQSALSSLTKQDVELRNQKLEVLAGLLALPGQVSSITAIESTSQTTGDTRVTLAGQINEQKKIEQLVKDDLAKKEVELGKEELVNFVGIYVMKNSYKAKLEYDKCCDKMLNRWTIGKITNCDVLSKGKGTYYTESV